MKAILIEGDDSTNFKLLLELARKLNIKTQILTSQEKEDIAFGKAIVEEESGEYVSMEELQKKLME